MTLLSTFLQSNSFINVLDEHVSIFVVEEGETIQKGDFVVINTRTLLARKPVSASGYFTVGVAARIIDQANGHQLVVCVDGYHMLYDPEGNISENDIGKACYYLDAETVTMDNINRTRAGVIAGIELSDDPIDIADGTDRMIFVKTDLKEGVKWNGNKSAEFKQFVSWVFNSL